MASNLYLHFPFCRRKCTYCALHSRAGSTGEERDSYARGLAAEVAKLEGGLKTVYFGGGSPAMCDLGALFEALAPKLAEGCEFTVELHPLDAAKEALRRLKDGGVNRISMGIQSLDDGILKHMGRGYTFHEAERAFMAVKEEFDNAGIDLIIGYPGETSALTPRHARLAKWGLRHCSAYSLILEEKSILAKMKGIERPDDQAVMDRLAIVSRFLGELGLKRYEISSWASPGYECRHNLAVWRGEDYTGLGEGAFGREGLRRTESGVAREVTEEEDALERAVFRLRTREGLEAREEWMEALGRFEAEGLLAREGKNFRLTERGTEVCDTILAELV